MSLPNVPLPVCFLCHDAIALAVCNECAFSALENGPAGNGPAGTNDSTGVSLCKTCDQAKHSEGEAAQHVRTAQKMVVARGTLCDDCEQDEARFLCPDCEELLCPHCDLRFHLKGTRRVHVRIELQLAGEPTASPLQTPREARTSSHIPSTSPLQTPLPLTSPGMSSGSRPTQSMLRPLPQLSEAALTRGRRSSPYAEETGEFELLEGKSVLQPEAVWTFLGTLLQTEQHFAQDFKALCQVFVAPLVQGSQFDFAREEPVQSFLRGCKLLLMAAVALNNELEGLLAGGSLGPTSSLLVNHAAYFHSLGRYAAGHARAAPKLNAHAQKKGGKFALFVADCERHPDFRGKSLSYLLNQPYQQIVKLKALLGDLLDGAAQANSKKQHGHDPRANNEQHQHQHDCGTTHSSLCGELQADGVQQQQAAPTCATADPSPSSSPPPSPPPPSSASELAATDALLPWLEKTFAVLCRLCQQVDRVLQEREWLEEVQLLEKKLGGVTLVVEGQPQRLLQQATLHKFSPRGACTPVSFYLLLDRLLVTGGASASSKLDKALWFVDGLAAEASQAAPDHFVINSPAESFVVQAAGADEAARWVQAISAAVKQHERQQRGDGDEEEEGLSYAPVWVPDSKAYHCFVCDLPFSMMRRRHHCRACGECVCGVCSPERRLIASIAAVPVRVCIICNRKLQQQEELACAVPATESAAEGAKAPPSLHKPPRRESLLPITPRGGPVGSSHERHNAAASGETGNGNGLELVPPLVAPLKELAHDPRYLLAHAQLKAERAYLEELATLCHFYTGPLLLLEWKSQNSRALAPFLTALISPKVAPQANKTCTSTPPSGLTSTPSGPPASDGNPRSKQFSLFGLSPRVVSSSAADYTNNSISTALSTPTSATRTPSGPGARRAHRSAPSSAAANEQSGLELPAYCMEWLQNTRALYELHQELYQHWQEHMAQTALDGGGVLLGQILARLVLKLPLYLAHVRHAPAALQLLTNGRSAAVAECKAKLQQVRAGELSRMARQQGGTGGEGKESNEKRATRPADLATMAQRISLQPAVYAQQLQALLEATPAEHADQAALQQVLSAVKELLGQLAQAKAEGVALLGLQRLAARFFNPKPLGADFLKVGRALLREGILERMTRRDRAPFVFMLLSDQLLYSADTPLGLKLHRQLQLLSMRVKDAGNNSVTPFAIEIQTPEKSFVVCAADQQSKDGWLADLQRAVSSCQVQAAKTGDDTNKELVVAPVWTTDSSSPVCPFCKKKWTIRRRRHHCRSCGQLVCDSCSPSRLIMPNLGPKPVRICNRCHQQHNVLLDSTLRPPETGTLTGRPGYNQAGSVDHPVQQQEISDSKEDALTEKELEEDVGRGEDNKSGSSGQEPEPQQHSTDQPKTGAGGSLRREGSSKGKTSKTASRPKINTPQSGS